MHDVLNGIKKLREQTAIALADVLTPPSSSKIITEKSLATAWHQKLQGNSHLYDGGWYDPPPHGIICKFGKQKNNYSSLETESFRPSETWPSDNIVLEPEDICLLYASPVERQTGLIGDFGINFYKGEDAETLSHLENVLVTTIHSAKSAKVGMPFYELYDLTIQNGNEAGLHASNVESTTDPIGNNIGHTIPYSYDDRILPQISNNTPTESIRNARIFINKNEEFFIQDNMAFTFEPRFFAQKLPSLLFHITIIFKEGELEICHNYRTFFEQTNMKNLIRYLP